MYKKMITTPTYTNIRVVFYYILKKERKKLPNTTNVQQCLMTKIPNTV